MGESRLRELMDDLVADIENPPMGQRAWRTAQRSKQRRVVGMAAAGVLVIGAGVAVAGGALPDRRPTGPTVQGSDQAATASARPPGPTAVGPRLRTGPQRSALDGLPKLSTPFAALSRLPSSAGPLSANPVARIVAAVQRPDGPVLVLGQDGTWREVDGALATEPGAGGARVRLTSTSISSDARRLALARGDGLLVVDATAPATAAARRLLPVPDAVGRVDNLIWLPGGDQIAVSGDGGAGQVSTRDGSYRSTPQERVHELAVSRPGDAQVHLAQAEIVVQDAGKTARYGYATGTGIELDEWYGSGWVRGTAVAGTGFLGGREHDGEQAVLVVDVTGGQVAHVLTLPSGQSPATRSNGCCATLGWLDDGTVLLRDGGQLLAWRFSSGAVFNVARLPGTATQGNDPGYNTTLALAQP